MAGVAYSVNFGPITMYFAENGPPSQAGDGMHYQRGDWWVCTNPTNGSYALWVNVAAASVVGSSYGSWRLAVTLA